MYSCIFRSFHFLQHNHNSTTIFDELDTTEFITWECFDVWMGENPVACDSNHFRSWFFIIFFPFYSDIDLILEYFNHGMFAIKSTMSPISFSSKSWEGVTSILPLRHDFTLCSRLNKWLYWFKLGEYTRVYQNRRIFSVTLIELSEIVIARKSLSNSRFTPYF